MTKSGLPNSIRKFIRKEKARIRREVLDLKEQEKLISQLYEKLLKKPEYKKPTVRTQEDKKQLYENKRNI